MATIRNCINDTSTELFIKDDTDNTKVLFIGVSGITTATTRTWTVDDRNIDFDAVSTSIVTDSGSCTPASGSFTVSGAGSVSTSASGSTITVTGAGGAGGVISWVILTGSESEPYSLSNNTGYVCTSGGGLTTILPTTAAVGTVIRVMDTSGARIITIEQNASQQITGVNGSTTAGITGYLFTSTPDRTSIELVCIVANTSWVIVSDNSGSYTLI